MGELWSRIGTGPVAERAGFKDPDAPRAKAFAALFSSRVWDSRRKKLGEESVAKVLRAYGGD